MNKFIYITDTEMHEFLDEFGMVKMNLPEAHEVTYSCAVPGSKGLEIRVFTSIVFGRSRKYGKDAIRVVTFDTSQQDNGKVRPIGAQEKVLRTEGWKVRLKKQIEEAFDNAITNKKCPDGHYMIVRTVKKDIKYNGKVWRKKGSKFLGCSLYPQCKYTEPYTGSVTREELAVHCL